MESGERSQFQTCFFRTLLFYLERRLQQSKGSYVPLQKPAGSFRPENGMAVTIRGYISLYEQDGNYQLYAQEIEPDGTGALYLAFEQLKARLQKEGLFDRKYKKELPLLPRRIGLVTSPTGAAVRDLLEIIRRRWPGLQIVLVPVPVQGATAPPAVARGIELLNRVGGIELIIVGRGGGSLEEIWAFNTEIVARVFFGQPYRSSQQWATKRILPSPI